MTSMSDASAIDPELIASLVAAAAEARGRSYSPYSDFRAGAAVLTDGGDIVAGAIVENISLGLAMCAERVAMFAAATSSAETPRLRALVLAAPSTGTRLTWPCGACRQVALELGGNELLIAAIGEHDAGDRPPDLDWRRLGEFLPDAPHRRR